jgi:hypothetical protein
LNRNASPSPVRGRTPDKRRRGSIGRSPERGRSPDRASSPNKFRNLSPVKQREKKSKLDDWIRKNASPGPKRARGRADLETG